MAPYSVFFCRPTFPLYKLFKINFYACILHAFYWFSDFQDFEGDWYGIMIPKTGQLQDRLYITRNMMVLNGFDCHLEKYVDGIYVAK